jgi:hypothetical protein
LVPFQRTTQLRFSPGAEFEAARPVGHSLLPMKRAMTSAR